LGGDLGVWGTLAELGLASCITLYVIGCVPFIPSLYITWILESKKGYVSILLNSVIDLLQNIQF